MILSILIATIPERRIMFDRLLYEIRQQVIKANVEIEILADPEGGSIGAKRQRMIEKAQGEYVVFIDDDDRIDKDYLMLILNALKENPDVVGFNGIMTTNGRMTKMFRISKDFNYEEKKGVYYRYNNHLSPVKRELALVTGYKDIGYGEDYDYATRLKPLIKTEVYIDRYLYYYKYVTKK